MTDAFVQGQLVNDRYRVLGKLGGGGMADVFLAEDTTLARRVALKVLLPRFADDQNFVERFRREAKAAAGLNHPNVVGIYDWGQIDSMYYIVMEYVEGETLKELIRRRGRLPGNEAVGLALGLLAAIEFAHQHHIVHRDIKSQNILIDRTGMVKVTDFGIARAGDSSMTEAGSILGTAQYLAPEQARGEPVDERTDLYSVGVVIYEMLTGQVPFSGDSAVTVAMKHVNELPREPADLVPGMPYSLNQIVLKALAKSPDRRYASAAEFARDLRQAQAGGPVLAATFDAAVERTQVMGPLAIAGESATQVLRGDDLAETRVGGPRETKHQRSPWAIVAVVLLIVAAAAAAIVLYRVFSGTTKPVPGVVGMSQAAAINALRTQGFKAQTHNDYSDTVNVGYVTRQQPPADTKLISGGTVDIWVCRGRATITLLDFTGYTQQQMLTYLHANGLLGKALKGTSASAPIGTVFKQSPLAGTSVGRGSTVTYYISSGLPKVAVPSLAGLTQAAAQAALTSAGFTVGTVSQLSSATVPAGQVISQNPKADVKADKGSSVDFVVSTGSPPPSLSPSPTPSSSSTAALTAVPNVVLMDSGSALNTLSDAGFAVVIKQVGSPQPSGTVLKTSPAAGVLAPAGSTVTMTVAK
ncbi:MAG: Stk1 family PASTA domain-containing Ser/Thr kinase [Thermoleophilia bacterium]